MDDLADFELTEAALRTQLPDIIWVVRSLFYARGYIVFDLFFFFVVHFTVISFSYPYVL